MFQSVSVKMNRLERCRITNSKRGIIGNPTNAAFRHFSFCYLDQISVLLIIGKPIINLCHMDDLCACLVHLPWSVGMRGTSLAAGDTHSIWLPLTCPSTSVRLPKEQVMPAERSGTWLTFTSSCTGSEAQDNNVNMVRQSGPTQFGAWYIYI